MATLTPEQVTQYYASQGEATNPLSATDWLSQQQPAATVQAPAPQVQTPAAPTDVNSNAKYYDQIPAAVTQSKIQPDGSKTTTKTEMAAQPLQMPQNGSVVDLLNMAGQDSSKPGRKALAQQYGVQSYDFSGDKNKELADKFLAAFNANKGSTLPETGAAARSAINTYFGEEQGSVQDPSRTAMDIYANMNPIEAGIYQQLSSLLSTTQNKQTMVDLYKQEVAAQGIPEMNMELADINKIMNGTEDEIRDEITSSGSFATESQVAAMSIARNKNLLKRANYLTDVINAKNDYVDHIVSLTGADRDEADRDLTRKLGITDTLIRFSNQMTSNAKENYMNIVNSVGWGGLAATLKDNPRQRERVESLLGLAPGELGALAAYKKPLSEEEDLRLQNLRLQNQKFAQDLKSGPNLSTQVVDIGGQKVLINSKTGETIRKLDAGDNGGSIQKLSLAQANIDAITSLSNDPNINSAVGPNPAARFSFTNVFTGGKSNFIAGVEQLRQNLTLDNLIQAKANGATFGALSEGEMKLLQSASSKLGTWAIKDSADNIVGYKISEQDFKDELDKINNFAKLDFVLKGGDPISVGVQQMADGTYWTKNSDGTFTQIK